MLLVLPAVVEIAGAHAAAENRAIAMPHENKGATLDRTTLRWYGDAIVDSSGVAEYDVGSFDYRVIAAW
jgi:hypothetical protein